MKIFYKISIFLIIYALLAIPDNKKSIHIPETNYLKNSSKWWGNYAQNLVKFRITNDENRDYFYSKHRNALNYHLDELLLQIAEPDDPILDSVSLQINKLSALVSLMPTKINEFELDVARWRKLLKYQSRFWNLTSEKANRRLFQLITECRLVFESALIQSNVASTLISAVAKDPSAKLVTFGKLQFKAGDVIAFNLTSQNDQYLSFIRELPNAFKYIGYVHLENGVASIIYIDHIKGIEIVSLDDFFSKIGLNGVALRLRSDIPALRISPGLPTLAATVIHKMAEKGNYKFDYNGDYNTYNYVYDWELINKVYNLNMNHEQYVKKSEAIHYGSFNSHFKAFEIEFDHRFIITGEWYNSELLYKNRLLTAAITTILSSDTRNDFNQPIKLPLYRLLKMYSMIFGSIGFDVPIPSGVTAQTQLFYDELSKKQKKMVAQLETELSAYENMRNHKATYLKILQKADEINAEQLAGSK